MVQVTDGIEALSPNNVTLYYTTDPQLSNLPILVFHGASTTANSTLNSSRIQVHIFSAAGFQSYPRITVSPNSPFYAAVDQLCEDDQGDEICRGLAFGLLRYFKDVSEVVKSSLIFQSSQSRGRRPGSAPPLFGDQHAADLASAMVKVDNIVEIIEEIKAGLQTQNISHVDIDLVLPPGSIVPLHEEKMDAIDDDSLLDPSLHQYGSYAPLVKLFGEAAFLPTSKLRRAPSKPTALNRITSFLKEQKLSLRREMGELVDTEERYVIKMHELINHIADDFRQKAKNKAFGSVSPSVQDLQKLFPSSLDKILEVNTAFLAAVREVMEGTQEEAVNDLETRQDIKGTRYGGTGQMKDASGALAFAKVLLEWFPRFSDCYQDYIRASQEFPRIITSFLKQQSSFSQRVQQTGEQRLRSAIIEPVQRLPRYNLFIDNIAKYLPINHPALRPILKARDIITTICSMDSPAADKFQAANRLRSLVELWPPNFAPQGRLISAVDFVEFQTSYNVTARSESLKPGMLLLFAERVVILWKAKDGGLSARGIIAEIDKPSAATLMAPVTAAAGGQAHSYELKFGGSYLLSEIRFTESTDGRIIWMSNPEEGKVIVSAEDQKMSVRTMHAFILQGPYDGKASKWTEEVTKAKIENRFSEAERDTEYWCLRNINLIGNGLNIYASIFEEGLDSLVPGRKEPAPVRIVVDHQKGTKGAPIGHYGVEIVANITSTENLATSTCRLEISGLNDRVFIDAVDATTFMPVFIKRVGDLIRAQYGPENSSLATAFIHHYSNILKSLTMKTEGDKIMPFRPPSPVKLLSGFLSGGGTLSSVLTSTKQPRTPQLGNVPSMPPPSVSRKNSHKGDGPVFDGRGSTSSRAPVEEIQPLNPLFRLEETLTGYIAALQSRKGNIVGKVLRNRAAASELSVNALYNSFIETPFDAQTSSEVSVDVLFAAFEKFLKMAWKDQMGPVIKLQTLQVLHEKSLKLFPGDFADFLKIVFADMAPQNKRAFVGIVKLLTDLLDGCGNDGDRGSLTVTFAEILVVEGDPHGFINLLDRLVEDGDHLFDDTGAGISSGYVTPTYGSVSSTSRSMWSSNTGSITSNTSSIRKKFGFDTLLRQNSKNDSDSRPSMWRTLSKTSRNAATVEQKSSSLSKASLSRSRSIEIDMRIETPKKRPISRDRPTVLGAFDERPSSSHMQSRLSTIGASPPQETASSAKLLKKKRRSSLSDLKSLMAAASLNSSYGPARTNGIPFSETFDSSPRTPSPSKAPAARPASYIAGQRKENTIAMQRNIGNLSERPQNIMSEETVLVKELWSTNAPNKPIPSSNIPTPNGVVRESTPARSESKLSANSQKSSPQKLRLQSPQKLRERLQREAKAINAAEASLQSELSKIGEEMAKLNGSRTTNSNSAEVQNLSYKIKALESKIPTFIKDLTSRNEAVKSDLEKSLQASEYKIKGLDQLYREVTAENELLYEKFNGELGKIVKALKGKGKEDKEDLVLKTKEALEETAKWKKENAKLRRELLALKTIMKGNE